MTAQEERPLRELSARARAAAREVYVSGLPALVEPGPAAAGLVILDANGRTIAHRSHYLGTMTRPEASARALLQALRLLEANEVERVQLKLDDADLVRRLQAGQSLPRVPGDVASALREALEALPDVELQHVSPSHNPARTAALAPLVDWLPSRSRRAERMIVRPLGEDRYGVSSQDNPDQVYEVVLGTERDGQLTCQCTDFEYRGVPCKHLLAVAQQTDAVERLFRPTASTARSRSA